MMVKEQIKQELRFGYALAPERIEDEAWLIEYGLDSLCSMVLKLEEYLVVELADKVIARLQMAEDALKLTEQQLEIGRKYHAVALPNSY